MVLIGNQDLISEPIGIGYIPQKVLNSMQRKDFSIEFNAEFLNNEQSYVGSSVKSYVGTYVKSYVKVFVELSA